MGEKNEKSKSHMNVRIIEYLDDAIVIKTNLKKATGSNSVISSDKKQELSDSSASFDRFVHVIYGTADNGIKEECNYAEGRWVDCVNCPYAKLGQGKLESFTLIDSVIKGGYLL